MGGRCSGEAWCTAPEFWAWHPREFWSVYDARRPRRVYGQGATALHEDEARELFEKNYGPIGQGH